MFACALTLAPDHACASDPYEPDNTLAEAKQIATDGVAREHWYEGEIAGGVDWLWFEAHAGKTYRLQIARGTVWSLPSPDFFLPDGSWVADETGYGARTEVLFYADADGPIYVRLLQKSYMETGSYYVSVLEGTGDTLGLADNYEPDDTIRSARDLPVDGTVQHRLNGPVDLASIRVTAGKVYQFDARLDGVDWGYVLCSIVTTDGTAILGQDFVTAAEKLRYFTASSTGTLYARVTNASTGNSSPYTLAVTELNLSTLQGKVTRAADGSSFEGARVTVHSAWANGPSKGLWGITTTAADGTWSMRVQPGYYTALIEDPSGVLLPEYYGGGIPPLYAPTPIAANEETIVAGLDARLWALSSLEGTVSAQDIPVPGSTVSLARQGDWRQLGTVASDASGYFSFKALDPRYNYTLTASPTGGYIAVGPVTVFVPSGQTVRTVIPMSPPGSISGTVMDRSKGLPLQGIAVNVWPSTSGPMLGPSTVTDAQGGYRITGLPTGGYRLMFTDPAGKTGPYGQIWNGTSLYAWEDPIPVLIGQDTPNVDVAFHDHLPPITTHDVDPAWRNGPVEIELTAEDQGWMGVTTYTKAANSPSAQTYTEPFMHASEGQHTYMFWSEDGLDVDGRRNIEAAQTLTVRIDNTPPVSRVASAVANGVFMAPAVIEIKAADKHSGVSSLNWNVSGKKGTGPIVRLDKPGDYTLTFSATDIAGNVEASESVSFSVAERRGLLSGAGPSDMGHGDPFGDTYNLDLGWPVEEGLEAPKGGPGLEYDGGNRMLYVAESGYGDIESYHWDGTPALTLENPNTWYGPVDLGLDANGGLYCVWSRKGFAAWNKAGSLLWYNHLHSDFILVAADASPDGEVWVVPKAASGSVRTSIYRFTSSKNYDWFWVGVNCAAVDISFAPDGELYVAGMDNTIRVLAATEQAPEVRKWTVPEAPRAVEVDRDGYVYVCFDSRIRKYTKTGALLDEFDAQTPSQLAADDEGNVYAGGGDDGTVLRYIHGLKSTAVPVAKGTPVSAVPSPVSGFVSPPISGLPVNLQYSSNGVEWTSLATGITKTSGAFAISGTPPSAGYMRVVAGGDSTFAGSASVPLTVASVTKIGVSPNASMVSYGSQVKLTASLSDTAGRAMSSKPIVFESLNGGVWGRVSSATTGADGKCSVTLVPRANVRYRARFAGDAAHVSSQSDDRAVLVQAKLGTPVTHSLVARSHKTRVYGYLLPRHPSGGKAVELQFYRRKNGRWVYWRQFSAVSKNSRGRTKYIAYVSLPYTGEWKVRAKHADADHALSYSSYRQFSVK